MEINDQIKSLLQILEDKYQLEDQELAPYLEGLVYNDYLDYWDYIHVDVLLNLQNRRTGIPDEMIFIIYHQITELYFKLCLWEYQQILAKTDINAVFLGERVRRIISYFQNLTKSFEIMINGMEVEQFLKFRLSLLPASGFQSAQYRMIEIASTDLINLVDKGHRDEVANKSIEEQYEYIYWKYGATLLDTGKKTLTLRRFEEKYAERLINWAKAHKGNNLLTVFRALEAKGEVTPELKERMRELDAMINVKWPLVHFKSAVRYLKQESAAEGIPATGGTNWEKYLPPRFQRRIFYPELWQDEELQSWGKLSKES
jgi:tryptophan 2,3-dioxygenase